MLRHTKFCDVTLPGMLPSFNSQWPKDGANLYPPISNYYINRSQAHPKCHCQDATHFQPDKFSSSTCHCTCHESKAFSPIFLNSFFVFFIKKNIEIKPFADLQDTEDAHLPRLSPKQKKHKKKFFCSPHKHIET